MKNKTRFLAHAGLIAALYAALTLALAPISYGEIQLRVSEALTLLPVLSTAAIPGLTIGCLIANLLGSASVLDIVFGTLATLIASVATYLLRRNKYLAALCPVVANGVIVGAVLSIAFELPLFLTMLTVAAGEVVACYVLGIPLLALLKRTKLDRFFTE